MAKSETTVCVVVPCYNEEETLDYLLRAIADVKKELNKKYALDLLLVNDGSADATLDKVRAASKKTPYIFYRSFAHNAGHQSALRAGLEAAVKYDVVIMMDADLQHPPKYIPKMLELWEQSGANIIQMVRNDSMKEAGAIKYLTSRAYYVLINWLSGLKLEYGSSDFRLIDNATVNVLARSNEKDLFLRGYFSWLNAKRMTLGYHPDERVAGTSKYTFKKMLNLAGKGVLQFSDKPLRVAVNFGLIIAGLSALYGLFLIIDFFTGGRYANGWLSLVVIMLFCFGINFTILGFIGTYLAQALKLQKNRPEYIIGEEKLIELA